MSAYSTFHVALTTYLIPRSAKNMGIDWAMDGIVKGATGTPRHGMPYWMSGNDACFMTVTIWWACLPTTYSVMERNMWGRKQGLGPELLLCHWSSLAFASIHFTFAPNLDTHIFPPSVTVQYLSYSKEVCLNDSYVHVYHNITMVECNFHMTLIRDIQ